MLACFALSTQAFFSTSLGQGPAIKNETELKWSSQSEMGTLLDSGHLSKGIIASTSEEKIIGVLGSPEIEINLCTVSSSTEEAVGYVVPWGEH